MSTNDLYIKTSNPPQVPPEIDGKWFTIWFDNSPRARFRRFIKSIIHWIKPIHYTHCAMRWDGDVGPMRIRSPYQSQEEFDAEVERIEAENE